MISRRVLLSVAVAFGIGAATNRPGADLSRQADQAGRAVPAGRADRHHGAPRRARTCRRSLGQQVIVENRPGAGSTIGSKAAARADPDGYTLLFGSSGSLGVAPALYANPRHRSAQVVRAGRQRVAAAARHGGAGGGAGQDGAEFVAYAKANPGKLNYGAGLGTPPHLLATLFKTKAGLDITYVPYKGAAPSVTDLLGGQTHFTIDGMLILMPQIKAGKLRALARRRARSAGRSCPSVPTMTESGYPDFTIDAWTGVVAPAGTPPQIIEKLNGAVNAGLLSPETETAMARFSSITKIGTPEEFAAFIASEAPRWAAMVKLADAKVE